MKIEILKEKNDVLGIPGPPIFGITGMPSSSNFNPGARSFIISAGGWPYCCISNSKSVNLVKKIRNKDVQFNNNLERHLILFVNVKKNKFKLN